MVWLTENIEYICYKKVLLWLAPCLIASRFDQPSKGKKNILNLKRNDVSASYKPNLTKPNPAQHNSTNPNTIQPNPTQDNTTQPNPPQPTPTQDNTTQHNITQPHPTQLKTNQKTQTQTNLA
jgi:hypothetical protein